MSSDALNPLSYVVLALIGRGGAAPHDLVDMMRRGGRLYYSAAPSKVYAEPKRLERLGYVASRKAPGRTRERTVYVLTPAGEQALADWLARPSRFPRIYSEAVCRVMAGDLADDAVLVESVRALRAEVDELERLIDEAERIAPSIPHRTRYLRLVHSLGRRLLAAHREWADEVERELAS